MKPDCGKGALMVACHVCMPVECVRALIEVSIVSLLSVTWNSISKVATHTLAECLVLGYCYSQET